MRLPRSALVVLVVAAAFGANSAAAQQCRVSYRSSPHRPLLFGGVVESCQGLRCHSRNDFYAKRCAANDDSQWGTCSQGQSKEIIDFARRTMGDGVNLSPCDLMNYLQGRTLWILGDSHTKTLWTALQCFLIDFWDHNVCAPHVDDGAVQELANLPKVKGHSNCLHLLGAAGGRICIIEVILGTYLTGNSGLPAGGVLPLLRQKFAQPQDIFYVNFGAWHRKNNADWATFVPALEALGKDYQQNKGTWPHLLFRENAAIHPKNLDKKVCDNIPGYELAGGQLKASQAADLDEQMRFTIGRPLSELVNTVLPRYGVPVVQSFNYTVPLYGQHIEMRQVPDLDCIHYCYPGVPQMWIADLYNSMRSGAAGIQPLKVVSRPPTWNWGGNSNAASDDGGSPAPATASPAGGRSRSWFEALRFPLGRRLQGDEGQGEGQVAAGPPRFLQQREAQKYQCVRAKVTF